MKRFIATHRLTVCFCWMFLLATSSAFACDLTQTTLISVVPSGGDFIITTQLCIGAGRTGGVNGADGDTQDLVFGLYRAAGPLTISSFTPANMTSSFRGCTLPGLATGPLPFPPFDTQEGVYYQFFSTNPGCTTGFNQSFTCVVSTAQCGNVHSDCFTVVITVDELPDSMRVFGVEGAGNPTAGCYPNPDMLVAFTPLPVVWASFDGVALESGNQLKWSTSEEINNERFEVLRSADGQQFEAIATVASIASNSKGNSYTYLDQNPIKGFAQYKIRQYDQDGRTSETETIGLTYSAPQSVRWVGVGPLPAQDRVVASFLSEKDRDMDLVLLNTAGQVVLQQAVAAKLGNNSMELNLDGMAPGMYFVRLQGGNAQLDYKIMKL
jgi:Secretion system C-terminal sorting domain